MLVSPELDQWIVRSRPEYRILPVLIMSYTWLADHVERCRPFSWVQTKDSPIGSGFFPLALKRNPEKNTTEFCFWGLTIPKSILRTKDHPQSSHLFLIVESHLSQMYVKNTLGPALSNLFASTRPSLCMVMTFGQKAAIQRNVQNSSFFYSTTFQDMFCGDAWKRQTRLSSALSQACLFAVEEVIEHNSRTEKQALMEAWTEINRSLVDLDDPPTWSPKQTVEAFSRSIVLACADQAVLVARSSFVQRKLDAIQSVRRRECLDQFVILFDPNRLSSDNHSQRDLDRAIMYASQLRAVSKLVPLGPVQEMPQYVLSCHFALTTLSHFERKLFYGDEGTLEDTLNQLVEDLKHIQRGNAVTLKVPQQTPYGDGFIVHADASPSRFVSLLLNEYADLDRSVDGDFVTVLFRTRHETPPPPVVLTDQRTEISFPHYMSRLDSLQALRALRNLSVSARLAAGRGRVISFYLTLARLIVDRVTSEKQTFDAETLGKDTSPGGVVLEMRRRKTMLSMSNELREVLNDIESASSLYRSGTSLHCAASWLTRPLEWKYGKRALRQSLLLTGDSDEDSIMDRVRKEHMKGGGATADTSMCETLPELLYVVPVVGIRGIRCQIGRSEASLMDPFQVRVEFVGSEYMSSSCQVCRELDAEFVRKDEIWKVRTPDAILLGSGSDFDQSRRQTIASVFNAIMLTRNPTLSLPNQHTALVFVGFVRSCEQLLRWSSLETPKSLPSFDNMDSVLPFIQSCRDLFMTCQHICTFSPPSQVKRVIDGMHNRQELPTWLPKSETGGVSSVCEALVVSCCVWEHSSVVSRGFIVGCLLAEAVARQARTVIKKRPAVGRAMVRKALGITLESCPDVYASSLNPSDHIDIRQGFEFTVKFFSQPCLTNCSVFGVVATVLLCELFNAQASDVEVYQKLSSHQVSMKGFFAKYFSNLPPRIFQIALFVQGFVNYNNKTRARQAQQHVQGLMQDPKQLLKDFAKSERLEIFKDRVNELRLKQTAESHKQTLLLKRNLELAEQTEFLSSHGHAPRVFDFQEIAQLNEQRPANDQLELDPNTGLLKHHCCFEDCPMYLVSLRTEKDALLGTRNGLFQHLKPLFHPEKLFVSELHLKCRLWVLGEQLDKRHFMHKLQESVKDRDPKVQELVLKKFAPEVFEKYASQRRKPG